MKKLINQENSKAYKIGKKNLINQLKEYSFLSPSNKKNNIPGAIKLDVRIIDYKIPYQTYCSFWFLGLKVANYPTFFTDELQDFDQKHCQMVQSISKWKSRVNDIFWRDLFAVWPRVLFGLKSFPYKFLTNIEFSADL